MSNEECSLCDSNLSINYERERERGKKKTLLSKDLDSVWNYNSRVYFI